MTAAALENAEAAVVALTSFLSQPVNSDRDRAGVIQAFEFTFEPSGSFSRPFGPKTRRRCQRR